MRKVIFWSLILILSGCASTPIEKRRETVLQCVQRLGSDSGNSITDAFEVCRQVYGMRKVKE